MNFNKTKKVAFIVVFFMMIVTFSLFFVVRDVTAKKRVPSHVTVITAGNGKGTIAVSRAGYADQDITNQTLTFPRSTQITLTATPHSSGSTFEGWGGAACVDSKDPCTLTLEEHEITLTSTFSHPSAKYDIEHPNTPHTENGVTVEFIGSLPIEPSVATGINIGVGEPTGETLELLGATVINVTKTFNILATNQLNEVVTDGFSAKLTFSYPGANDVDEARYTINYWNGTAWSTEGISDLHVNTAANTIAFNTNHFSEFSVKTDGKITANIAADGSSSNVPNNGILPSAGMGWVNLIVDIIVICLLVASLIFYRFEQKIHRLEKKIEAKKSKKP